MTEAMDPMEVYDVNFEGRDFSNEVLAHDGTIQSDTILTANRFSTGHLDALRLSKNRILHQTFGAGTQRPADKELLMDHDSDQVSIDRLNTYQSPLDLVGHEALPEEEVNLLVN